MKTIGKISGTVALIFVLAIHVFAAEYALDKKNSTVKWNGKKVTGEHYGTIELSSGILTTDGNRIKSGSFQMDMTSIVNKDISNEAVSKKLVDHLKSDDFFSVDKHPVSMLVIKNAAPKEGKVYTFTGDLTIKGITHPVVFDAVVEFTADKFTAKGKMEVDRTLYDVRYGSGKFFAGLGDNLIHDIFTLDFDVTARSGGGTALNSAK